MDTNINIIFSNQQFGGSESDPEVPGATPNPEAPEQNKQGGKESNKSKATASAIAVAMVKQGVNATISRVGVMTRSNVKQAQVNSTVKMVGYGVGFGAAVASQNWAAVAVMAISIGADTVTGLIDYNRNSSIERNTLSIARERAGINRSR